MFHSENLRETSLINSIHTISAHLRNSEVLIKWEFLRTCQPLLLPQY